MKKIVVCGVATLAIMGAAGSAVASKTDGRSAQAGGATVTAKRAVTVQRCDSGPVQRVYNRIVNQPSLSFEGADTPVPGARLGLVAPANGGTVNVTFSAEDQL